MPAKHATQLQQVYDQVAQAYLRYNPTIAPQVLEQMLKFSSFLPRGGHILDVGAGTGRDAAFFTQQGFQVTLLELSPEMLVIAQQAVPDSKIIQGDMLEVELDHETYDGVWASASLLHLTKAEMPQMLGRLIDTLKPGGHLYLRLKKGEGEQEVLDSKYDQPINRFFSFYTESELVQLVTEASFKLVTTFSDQSTRHTWVSLIATKPIV